MREYEPVMTCTLNRKGVLDLDTVKGCAIGMSKYKSGCYGLCYAAKMAKAFGYVFSKSVSRYPAGYNSKQSNVFGSCFLGNRQIFKTVKNHKARFFRIGTMGDPSHDWELTANICAWLRPIKTPVVVTKHWLTIPENLLRLFEGTVFNTSISALDNGEEIKQRLLQFNRLKSAGFRSVLRIVSCKFGDTIEGRRLAKKQQHLFENSPIIDNPLRISAQDKRVTNGDVVVEKIKDLNSEVSISLAYKSAYVGDCWNCPDQCGVL